MGIPLGVASTKVQGDNKMHFLTGDLLNDFMYFIGYFIGSIIGGSTGWILRGHYDQTRAIGKDKHEV